MKLVPLFDQKCLVRQGDNPVQAFLIGGTSGKLTPINAFYGMIAVYCIEFAMPAWTRTLPIFFIAAFAMPASAADAPAANLQFSDIGKVTEWKAGGEATVYVKDKNGQWYKADLAETCMSLDTSGGVRFITSVEPLTKVRESKVTVGRHICMVIELVKIAGAPPESKKAK